MRATHVTHWESNRKKVREGGLEPRRDFALVRASACFRGGGGHSGGFRMHPGAPADTKSVTNCHKASAEPLANGWGSDSHGGHCAATGRGRVAHPHRPVHRRGAGINHHLKASGRRRLRSRQGCFRRRRKNNPAARQPLGTGRARQRPSAGDGRICRLGAPCSSRR